MKPMRSILTTVGVAGLAAGMAFGLAPLVFGQAPLGEPAAHHHRNEARRAARRKMMIGYLGLTDDQQAKTKAIFSTAHESAQPLRQQLKQVRADLRTAIRAGQPVNDLAANEGKIRGQLAAVRANAAEQFRGLLTPPQLQKLEELHARAHHS